jgi:ABC-2 type transport system ATP-binding protein
VAAPAVEVEDLVISYGDKTAVDGLSLDVEQGSVTAILGPNGAGKTSTVETCEGYRRPDSGRVRVLGLDPVAEHSELMPRLGVMLQNGGVWNAVRAQEMLTFAASLHTHPLPVAPLVERLGLESCGRTPYQRLSGGQQQRLGLALALIGRPELVFLDEPTAGLDPQARRATWSLIEELASEGLTVVLTTHYMEEAERLADHIYLVDHGRVVTSGSPAQLTSQGSGATIRFDAEPGLDLDRLRHRLPAGCLAVSTAPGQYVVEGASSPAALAAVTDWLSAEGVMPSSLTMGRETLEDVFLRVTGHDLRS